MSSKPASRTVLVVVLVAGAVAIVLAALLGTTKVVDVEAETFDPAQIGDTPIVIAKNESGGFELFGVQLDAPDRWISVGLAPPLACVRIDGSGGEHLAGGDGCEMYADIAGPVQGGGTRADGTRWIEVRLEVDRTCFDESSIGNPLPARACAE